MNLDARRAQIGLDSWGHFGDILGAIDVYLCPKR